MPPPAGGRHCALVAVIFEIAAVALLRSDQFERNLQRFVRISHRVRQRELRKSLTDARLRDAAAGEHPVQTLGAGRVVTQLRTALGTTGLRHGWRFLSKKAGDAPRF